MQQRFQEPAYQHGVQGVGSSNLLAPTNVINDLQYHTVSKRSTVYKPKANIFAAFFLLIIALLTGCGGGSGGSSAPIYQPQPIDFPPGQYADHNSGPLPLMREPVLAGMRSVVFEGDSLTMLWDYTTWPTKVKNASTWTNTAWNDVGIGGTDTVSMVARYAANVHPLRPDIAGNGIFIINGGTGDLCNRIGDANSIYANLKTLWAEARADGFKVVATTLHASCAEPGTYWDNVRVSVNLMIRSDPSLYDVVEQNDILIPDTHNTSMLVDRLHYAPAANDAIYSSVSGLIAGW